MDDKGTLADEFDVGDPFASNPGVRVIFDCGPSCVETMMLPFALV